MLTPVDLDLRGLLTREIAKRGHAPSNDELAALVGSTRIAVEASLQRLHAAHALLLHPHECRPWVVHPFALSPGSCWVETAKGGWWANCAYCGLGIAAALGTDARITTRLGGERDTVEVVVEAGQVHGPQLVFHFATPALHWWDNVIHTCATFQLFRSECDIDDWCVRHALPKGVLMPLPQLWRFASEWYGGYLSAPWRKRSPDEIHQFFERHDLGGAFWSLTRA